MNQNTVKAIQARIDMGEIEFKIGRRRYVCHYDHPAFQPFVLRYSVGSSEPFEAGNIVNGIFIPDAAPVRRASEGGDAYTAYTDVVIDGRRDTIAGPETMSRILTPKEIKSNLIANDVVTLGGWPAGYSYLDFEIRYYAKGQPFDADPAEIVTVTIWESDLPGYYDVDPDYLPIDPALP